MLLKNCPVGECGTGRVAWYPRCCIHGFVSWRATVAEWSMKAGLAVTSSLDLKMDGCRRRGRAPPRHTHTCLLTLLVTVLTSAHVHGLWSHAPDPLLRQLKSMELTLPARVFEFDLISADGQQYPEHMRYRSLAGVSLCVCRHRCLIDLRCMGYEHEQASGGCGLTDVLAPAPVSEESVVSGWSTGRRRGISWLGAPCHISDDCSLLIPGAECGAEGFCACQRGWTALNETKCQSEAHWVQLPGTSLTGTKLADVTLTFSRWSCFERCQLNSNCWAVEYNDQAWACWLYSSADQTGGHALPVNTTALELQLGRHGADAPDSFTNIGGRLLALTGKVASENAVQTCLGLGGVQYVPDSERLVKKAYDVLGISKRGEESYVGAGFNDALEEGDFRTADDYALDPDNGIFPWSYNQPDNDGAGEQCGGFINDCKLNDFSCKTPIRQLCEYIGPILKHRNGSTYNQSQDQEGTFTWLTHDLEEPQLVNQILYVAPGDSPQTVEVLQIRVGESPDDRSELNSTLCVHQTERRVAAGFGRRFACAVPLAGRYVHVAQRPAPSGSLMPQVVMFGVARG